MNDLEEYSAENMFLNDLKHLNDLISEKKAPNTAYVYEILLGSLNEFIDRRVQLNDKEAFCFHMFREISKYILETGLKSTRGSFIKAMSIGQFIEIMIYNGFPRKHSISIACDLFNVKYSTARTYNEDFRRIYKSDKAVAIRLQKFLEYSHETVINALEYDFNHPLFKRCYKSTINHYIEMRAIRDKFHAFLKSK